MDVMKDEEQAHESEERTTPQKYGQENTERRIEYYHP